LIYSRGEEGESVGKIEDNWGPTIDDALLESILEDHVENGVEPILREPTPTTVEYGIGVVESGNKWFCLLCFGQHAAQSYYGDPRRYSIR